MADAPIEFEKHHGSTPNSCLEILPAEIWANIMTKIDCQSTYENLRVVSKDLHNIWHDPIVKNQALVKFVKKTEHRSPKGKVRVAHVMPDGTLHGPEFSSRKCKGHKRVHKATWDHGKKVGLEEWMTLKLGVSLVTHIVEWSDGKKSGTEEWMAGSLTTRELSWRNDRKHGLETRYDRTGLVSQTIEWRNNKKHGPERHYSGGVLLYEMPWSHNKRAGLERWYDFTGSVAVCREWKNNHPGPFIDA